MTAGPAHTPNQTLHGAEGDLLLLSIAVEPRLLEALLDALAVLHFPVNPQLYHRPAETLVEFPAYTERIQEVREVLRRHGFDAQSLTVAAPDGQLAEY